MKRFKLLLVVMTILTMFACSNVTAKIEENDTQIKTTVDAKNYPRVDGSTANIPMMAQIRSSYLHEDLAESQNNSLEVTTTDYAWRNLIDGKNDLLLVYEPSSETKKLIESSPVKLKATPIGVDALVFIVNEKNKVKNLTTEQIRDIYSGKITNWKDLGGDDATIEAYQRVLNSGSQTLFLNLVMKDVKPVDAPIKYRIEGMDGLIETLASYNNTGNALGYSVFYYAKKMYAVPGLELISVDGIMPSDDTIGSGKYPFLNQYYVVIREDTPADSETMKLYNYILSDKGKEDMRKAGYIPINSK
jgi:phosphate transport system substrate-binding protein